MYVAYQKNSVTTHAALHSYMVSINRLIGIENKFTSIRQEYIQSYDVELNSDNDDDEHGGSDADSQ